MNNIDEEEVKEALEVFETNMNLGLSSTKIMGKIIASALRKERKNHESSLDKIASLETALRKIEREVEITLEQWYFEREEGRDGVIFPSRMSQLKDCLPRSVVPERKNKSKIEELQELQRGAEDPEDIEDHKIQEALYDFENPVGCADPYASGQIISAALRTRVKMLAKAREALEAIKRAGPSNFPTTHH